MVTLLVRQSKGTQSMDEQWQQLNNSSLEGCCVVHDTDTFALPDHFHLLKTF